MALPSVAQSNQQPQPPPRSGGPGIRNVGIGLSINLGSKRSIGIEERSGPAPDAVADQVIFILDGQGADVTRIAVAARVAIVDITTLESVALTMVVARVSAPDTPDLAISRLQDAAGVRWAQRNHVYSGSGTTRSLPKRFALHGLPTSAAATVSGTIAIIDTPVASKHEALHGAVIRQFVYGESATAGLHGTAIASLLVGTGEVPGTARGATLLSLAAFTSDARSQTRYIAKAINAAVRLRPDVLNLSFAGKDDRLLSALLDTVKAKGICVAAAAGNGGPFATVPFPASHRASLAVTAVDDRMRAYPHATHGARIDVAGIGVDLLAAVPTGYRNVSGTSFATAIVSGGLLHMAACSRDHDPVTMHYGATAMALDLGAPGPDAVFGAGLFRLLPSAGPRK
jgi:Subtilase family